MNNPLVSIVIPVYNGSNYMKEAIDSALAQTYKNIEVLLVNDGSNDGGKTREIALSYGNKIRYFEKENGGVATALNLAINNMRGEYFSWLSHDDVYYPDKIKIQIEYIQNIGKNNIIIYSNWNNIDSNSQIIDSPNIKFYAPDKFRLAFVCEEIIHGCTLLIPSDCFKQFGNFNPALRCTQDYELWFRFSSGREFHCINSCLIKSRVHPEQGSFKPGKANLTECNNLYVNFFKNISFEEIKLSWKQSPGSYAVHFCTMMIKYKYYRAAWFVFCNSIKYFIRDPHLDYCTNMTKFILINMVYNPLNLLRHKLIRCKSVQ